MLYVLLVRIYIWYYSITFGVWYGDTYALTLPVFRGPAAQTADGDFIVPAPVLHQALFAVLGLRPRGFRRIGHRLKLSLQIVGKGFGFLRV